MDLKEFSGENVEAATEKAEAHFGLPRADLRIKVVADEKSGLYRVGLENRAVIVARPTPEAAPRARVQPVAAPSRPAERGGARGDRAPRFRREGPRPADHAAGEGLYKPRPSETGTPSAPRGPATEHSDRAREILEGILTRMPIAGDITVQGGETADAVELMVTADSGGLLTDDGGEALAALTYLVNRMANKGLRNTKRVVVEAEGFRSDHVASLEGLARDLAEKVRTSGEPERLAPMNSYDRRIVHMVLREAPGISTESDGEGPYKSVVIRPADKR